METGTRKSSTEPEVESSQNTESDALFAIHRQMVIFLFGATLILGLGLYLMLRKANASCLIAVAIAGAGGGFLSALRRLYSFQRFFPSRLLCNWPRQPSISVYVAVYSMIPPLVGAIAACVLYVVFAAGLVQGDLFPEFTYYSYDTSMDSFQNFLRKWAPNSPTGYAKSFVWGFIAGFSERFVPDLLGRLSNRKSTQTP